ncbi:MAG TPA: hypothetical protein VHO06_08545 [Polyangia bacterium]|nr:hypothetical protein [Polyangia bacterium]
MTSNLKRMLQGLLIVAVVSAAASARAQNLETPGAPAAEAAAAPAASTGPAGFGDGGQFVISAERLFGYNWAHPSSGSNANAISVLGNAFGVAGYPYDWPRLGFDYFLTKSVSGGIALAVSRLTAGGGPNGSSLNAFEVNPRLGYGMMVGPWLGVWPRAGVTYVNSTNLSYLGLTLDLQAVAVVAQHLAFTLAPVANIGLSGSGSGGSSQKFTTLGLEFGLSMPF